MLPYPIQYHQIPNIPISRRITLVVLWQGTHPLIIWPRNFTLVPNSAPIAISVYQNLVFVQTKHHLNHLLGNQFAFIVTQIDAPLFHSLHFVIMIIKDISRKQATFIIAGQHVVQTLASFLIQKPAPLVIVFFQRTLGQTLQCLFAKFPALCPIVAGLHCQQIISIGVRNRLFDTCHEFLFVRL